ncbi:hypothetical protein [Neoroseomonas soli]|nr:hypothetical protein [Neoroseomonas soli]
MPRTSTHNVDVKVQRWERITGNAAVPAGEERAFNDIPTARHS